MLTKVIAIAPFLRTWAGPAAEVGMRLHEVQPLASGGDLVKFCELPTLDATQHMPDRNCFRYLTRA